MHRHVIAIATSAMLMCAATIADAQNTTTQPKTPTNQQGSGMMAPHLMGPPTMMTRGGMMGGGTMGMMRGGPMGHRGMAGPVMHIIFALMDTDSDGTVSLQEFQAAHERIFKAMDANKDGKLTLEEMQSFIRGETKSSPSQSSPQ